MAESIEALREEVQQLKTEFSRRPNWGIFNALERARCELDRAERARARADLAVLRDRVDAVKSAVLDNGNYLDSRSWRQLHEVQLVGEAIDHAAGALA